MSKSLYEANKIGIMKWRSKNKDYYNQTQRKASAKYYENNKEKVKLSHKNQKIFKTQAEIFRMILLN